MTNEVPFYVTRKFLHFRCKFLFAALTEQALSGIISLAYQLRRMKLAYCHQPCAVRQIVLNLLQSACDVRIHTSYCLLFVFYPSNSGLSFFSSFLRGALCSKTSIIFVSAMFTIS